MSSESPTAVRDGRWWLPIEVAAGDALCVHIGPLSLMARRMTSEWQLAFERAEESTEHAGAEYSVSADAFQSEDFERFMFAHAPERVTIRPALADRPVVIRPRQPVFLPSGEEVTLYMSSPVTVRIETGDPGVLLREIPSVQLSDTWFGPSTREGELCYSGRTSARQELEEVPRRAHRVLTAARIRNESVMPLPLEKLSLPVPALSVYGTLQGDLWTESVSLVHSGDPELAMLHVDEGAPTYAGATTRLSPPRRPIQRGSLVRAFSILFRD